MIQGKSNINDLLKRAESSLMKGDYSNALALLKESIQKDPDNLEALYYLGILYVRVEELEKGISALSRILALNKPFEQKNHVRTLLGFLYSIKKDFDKARELLLTALKEEPYNIHAMSTLGYIAYQNKDYDKAIEYYNMVLDLDPLNTNALNSIGQTYIDSGKDIKKGIDKCEQALELAPDTPSIMDSLGWGYYKLGNESRAIEFLRKAFELAPDNPVIKQHLKDVLKI